MTEKIREFIQTYFHGTKADLKPGDQIVAGFGSNYVEGMQSKFAYLTSNLNVAAWGAELAAGEGAGRIYVVEAAGPMEDDPNVTDKKFPGNPTNSFRTREPLIVLGEVTGWAGHAPDEIKLRRERLEQLVKGGAAKIIED
jgi:rifampin ADP-ribosylating transferase